MNERRDSEVPSSRSGARLGETTLSIRMVWPFARVLCGHARAGEVLACIGFGSEIFADPETRVPHGVVMRMLEDAAARFDDPTVGLRAGLQLDSGDMGVVENAARSAPTLGDAIAILARYVRILNDAAETTLHVEKDLAHWCFRTTDGVRQPPQANDFGVASAIAFHRRNVAHYEPPVEVRFMHERPSYAAEYERCLGTKVRFGATYNTVVVKRAELHTPMLRPSPDLCAAFELQARNELSRLQAREGATGRVREEITAQFHQGSVSMHRTARRLAMSVATLRRRLSEEGTTFTGILDDLRKQLSLRYLRESNPSVSEIAFLLGFSDVATFGRAFKRWTGASPSEFRARLRDPIGADALSMPL